MASILCLNKAVVEASVRDLAMQALSTFWVP